MTGNTAIDLPANPMVKEHGLRVEMKRRLPLELNDGHGSYICADGYLHDYSKKDFGAIEREETAGPFKTFEEYKAWLADGDSD